MEILRNWLIEQGISAAASEILTRGIAIGLVILISYAADIIANRIILRGISQLIQRTKTRIDDFLVERKVLKRLAHLAPAMVAYILTPIALAGYSDVISFARGAIQIYAILVLVIVLNALLNAGLDYYRTLEVSREIPVKGFIQVIKIIIYFVAGVFLVAILVNKTPLFLLSGLGAMTAILMFIFKDAILGFVAGIQLTTNKMVARGDWIEMPKYGADGDVLDISLTTVKVQNWDKTITTIPTYALISESFKNWRGMSQSGGRRIKRSINIDMSTIKFCTEEMLQRFARINFIAEYIESKKKELEAFNKSVRADNTSLVNGRRMTNVGTFRAYVVAYLKNHPVINNDMTFLVRQLAPTEFGLPIEIYVFSKDKVWANYEAIQADIFDHILSVVPEFDLKVFQNPTGNDFQMIRR